MNQVGRREMTLSIARDVPLAPLTTLELGGPARWFVEAGDEAELRAALAWADGRGLASIVLGGGSNVVIADEGVDGLVIRFAARGVEHRESAGRRVVLAAAGEPWDPLVERCVAAGFAGLECLSGIPGSVGATPIQNVGAYGSEVADAITRVRVLDRDHASIDWWSPARCEFGYRTSAFKRAPGRHVVLAVELAVRPGAPAPIRYAELARVLGDGASPSVDAVRSAVLELRRGKSMVIEPDDPNRRSVGSFFTNPIVPAERAATLAERVRADHGELPSWPAGEGQTKLAAAWLIEKSGVSKGLRRGNVGVSTRHSLALVHHGGGTTRELLALAREIRDRVRQQFDIVLDHEPVLLGTTW